MRLRLLLTLGLACCAAAFALQPAAADRTKPAAFAPPVRLTADGHPVRVEAPGYAYPCLADVTGDGKPDLLVGQFNKGKICVYPGLGGGKFGPGSFLQAEGKVAEVPGVW